MDDEVGGSSSRRPLVAIRRDSAITPSVSLVLDAGRWISALLVVLGHLRTQVFLPFDQVTGFHAPFLAVVLSSGFGRAAVVVFFVISGYLVGGGLVLRRVETTYARMLGFFAVDRLTRLFIVVVPGLCLMWALEASRVLSHPSAARLDSVAYAPSTALVNAAFCQTILGPVFAFNYPLWSLANEFWYYVLFPCILITARPLAWSTRLISIGVGLAICFFVGREILVLFPVWLVGVAARSLDLRIGRAAAGLALLAGIGVFRLMFARAPTIASIELGMCFALLILACQQASNEPSRVWSDLHRSLAAFSFSLYVLHQPILDFMLWAWTGADRQGLGSPEVWATWQLYFSSLVLAILVAWLFSRVTEAKTPVLRKFIADRIGLASPIRYAEKIPRDPL